MKLFIAICALLPTLSYARRLADQNTDGPTPVVNDGSGVTGGTSSVSADLLEMKRERAAAARAKQKAIDDQMAKDAQDELAALAEKNAAANKDKSAPTVTPSAKPQSNSIAPVIVKSDSPIVTPISVSTPNEKKNCQRNAVGMIDPQKRHDELVRCNTLSN